MAKSMVVYESFLDATKDADPEAFKKIWLSLLEYGINDKDPEDLNWAENMAFLLMKPNVDANKKRRKTDDADNCEQLQTIADNCEHLSKDEDVDEDEDADEEKKKRGARFAPPTLSEVKAYCQERTRDGHPAVNPEAFYDFYQAKGWKVGKNPMKDWKASVRTWEQREKTERARSGTREQRKVMVTRDYDMDELERRLVGL